MSIQGAVIHRKRFTDFDEYFNCARGWAGDQPHAGNPWHPQTDLVREVRLMRVDSWPNSRSRHSEVICEQHCYVPLACQIEAAKLAPRRDHNLALLHASERHTGNAN